MNKTNSAPRNPGPALHADGGDLSAVLLGEANTQKLVQELQLHKIELEMQNEELQRIQEELKASWKQVDHLVVERTTELARAIESLSAEVQLRYEAEGALRTAYTEIETLKDQLQAENAQLRRELQQKNAPG
jgi:Skp family chaperone for outer membrane proteins